MKGLTAAERERLRIAIWQLERARKNLVAALGEPPVGHTAEHPVTDLDTVLHHADAAWLDATAYYVRRHR